MGDCTDCYISEKSLTSPHLSLNRVGRWCTTDDYTTSFLYFSLVSTASCHFEPVSYAAVEEDCTICLVIEVLDDSDKVGADVYFFMVAHNTACQTLSEAFLKFKKTW